MAELPVEITTIVLDLQRRLLEIIDRASRSGFYIIERYGETQDSITAHDQLQNVRERATFYYSRFYTLLLRIAEAYPAAPTDMLELLSNSIEDAQATFEALEATIQEARRDWNIL